MTVSWQVMGKQPIMVVTLMWCSVDYIRNCHLVYHWIPHISWRISNTFYKFRASQFSAKVWEDKDATEIQA